MNPSNSCRKVVLLAWGACACAMAASAAARPVPVYHVVDLGVAMSPYPSAVAALDKAGLVVGSELVDGTLTCVTFDHGVQTVLGTMGGQSCEANSVSNRDVIVGSLQLPDGSSNTAAFVYQNGVVAALGMIDGYTSSDAVGINRHGHVTGNVSNPLTNLAVIWVEGQAMQIPVPPDGVESAATAINVHDDVTGTVTMSNDHRHAFLWQAGQAIDLGTLGDAPNGESAGYAINDKGQVAGFTSSPTFPSHAALFSGGVIVDLGTIPANDAFATSVATDIDNRGWIVGTSDDGGGTTYAILWNGKKLFDIATLLDQASAGAWQLVSAQAINGSGQITGMAILQADGLEHAYLAVPVP